MLISSTLITENPKNNTTSAQLAYPQTATWRVNTIYNSPLFLTIAVKTQRSDSNVSFFGTLVAICTEI